MGGPRRRPSLEPRLRAWELALQRRRRRAGGSHQARQVLFRRRGSCRPRRSLSSELKDFLVNEGAQPSSHNVLPTGASCGLDVACGWWFADPDAEEKGPGQREQRTQRGHEPAWVQGEGGESVPRLRAGKGRAGRAGGLAGAG